jgi:cytidine deaminase
VEQNRSGTAVTLEEAADLLARARAARRHAYAPYSRFPVGAALLCEDGTVHTGCNVENASFGLTNCAERVALQKAISEGHRNFRALAVVGPEDDAPCSPCGACRQVMYEFGPSMPLITPGGSGVAPVVTPVAGLLPGAFGPADLTPGAGPV